jgi:hypothetical protein
MQQRQVKLNEMRQQLADSTAGEKEAISRQAGEARTLLEAESRRIASEIGSRVLHRPIGNADLN